MNTTTEQIETATTEQADDLYAHLLADAAALDAEERADKRRLARLRSQRNAALDRLTAAKGLRSDIAALDGPFIEAAEAGVTQAAQRAHEADDALRAEEKRQRRARSERATRRQAIRDELHTGVMRMLGNIADIG